MWRPRKPQPPITRTELGGLDDRVLVMVDNGWEGVGSVRTADGEGGGMMRVW